MQYIHLQYNTYMHDLFVLFCSFIFIIKRPKKKHWCPCFFRVKSNEEDDSAINEGMERDGGSDVSDDGKQTDVDIGKSSDDETPLIPASEEQPVKLFLHGWSSIRVLCVYVHMLPTM